MPTQLTSFAARHRTALRRSLWLAGCASVGAAAMIVGPQVLEALPLAEERSERLVKYADQLRVSLLLCEPSIWDEQYCRRVPKAVRACAVTGLHCLLGSVQIMRHSTRLLSLH